MTRPGQNLNQQTPIRPTEVKTWLTRESMSPLGRELMEIADKIETSDEEPMDEDALERELTTRRIFAEWRIRSSPMSTLPY